MPHEVRASWRRTSPQRLLATASAALVNASASPAVSTSRAR
jgi:hypothetical protein